MKNKQSDVDLLLRRAMKSTEVPSEVLTQNTKYKMIMEENDMNKSVVAKRSFSMAAVLMAVLLLATTAFAAWYFLKPSEVASQLDNKALSTAFDGENAININTSAASGDYTFTLLGVVTGKDITDQPYHSEHVMDERTYAVVAIQKADGSPMPSAQDVEYGHTQFFATPLVDGIKPWELNAFTMNGAYNEAVVDGVLYRLVECDGMTMFADRGLYFAISTGFAYDASAFTYDEQTGKTSANESFDGASAVFDLPLDKNLADSVKADEYLKNIGVVFAIAGITDHMLSDKDKQEIYDGVMRL